MFSYAWFDQGIYDDVIKARTDKKVLPQYAFDGADWNAANIARYA